MYPTYFEPLNTNPAVGKLSEVEKMLKLAIFGYFGSFLGQKYKIGIYAMIMVYFHLFLTAEHEFDIFKGLRGEEHVQIWQNWVKLVIIGNKGNNKYRQH